LKNAKNLIISFLVISLLCFACYTPLQAQVIPLNRLLQVERILYGSNQELPILKKISKIENTLYNNEQKGSLIERSNNIINYVLPSVDKPSLLFLMNTLEWTLSGDIGREPVMVRIASIEKMVFGEIRNGSLKQRIDRLLKLSLPSDKMPIERINFTADKLIRIKLLNKLSSRESEVGQKINFEVVNDVKQNTKLVIPAGTKGTLSIKKIEEAGKMGKDGDIKISFKDLMQLDGSYLSVELNEEAQEENKSQKLAIGASLLGTALFGLPGVVVGYFVEGEEEKIPAGSEFYIQSNGSQESFGLLVNNN